MSLRVPSPKATILTGVVASVALIITLTTVSGLLAQPKGPPPRDDDDRNEARDDGDRDDDDRPPPPRRGRPPRDDDDDDRGDRGRGPRWPGDHGPDGHRPPPPPHGRDGHDHDDHDGPPPPPHMGGPMGRGMGRRGPGGPPGGPEFMDFMMRMHGDHPLPKHEHLRRAARELEKAGLKDQAAALNKEADAAEEQFKKEHPPGGPGMQEVQKTVNELKNDVQTLRKQLEEVRAELQKLKEANGAKKAVFNLPGENRS